MFERAWSTSGQQYASIAQIASAGRVAPDVDENAFAFMIAGAIHNLIVSNEMYPRPTRDQLERGPAAIAARL